MPKPLPSWPQFPLRKQCKFVLSDGTGIAGGPSTLSASVNHEVFNNTKYPYILPSVHDVGTAISDILTGKAWETGTRKNRPILVVVRGDRVQGTGWVRCEWDSGGEAVTWSWDT